MQYTDGAATLLYSLFSAQLFRTLFTTLQLQEKKSDTYIYPSTRTIRHCQPTYEWMWGCSLPSSFYRHTHIYVEREDDEGGGEMTHTLR